jgi:uncharacterized membrane protein
MRTFEERLPAETRAWVEEGIVLPAQASAIIARYDGRSRATRRDRLVQTLALVGAAGVGLGVILFFAANWDAIPRFFRLALLVTAILGCYAGGDRLGASRPRVGHALQLLGCILFGASMFLVGQMYHVSTHEPLAFLLWTAAATAGAILLRSQPFAGLAALTGGAWLGYKLADAGGEALLLTALAFYSAALYAGGTRFRVEVLRLLGAVTGFVTLFLLTFGDVADEVAGASSSMPGWLVLGGAGAAALALTAVLALDSRRASAPWEAGAVGCFVVLSAAALAVDLGPLVPNVAFLALALGALAVGYAAGDALLVNLGLIAIVAEAAARFFDFFGRIMPRSVAFLVGGALVLALAWMLERQRARLVGRAG